MNLIRDNKVTTSDVTLADWVCGPDVGGIKAKSTWDKPLPAVSNMIEITEASLRGNEEVSRD